MRKKVLVQAFGWALAGLGLYWAWTHLDWRELSRSAAQLLTHGHLLLLAACAYAAAFYTRSVAWALMMGEGAAHPLQLWRYHQVGLLLNHVLPVKAGEAVRVYLLKENHGKSWGESIFSVGATRLLDMAALLTIAAVSGTVLAPAGWWGEKGNGWLVTAVLLCGVGAVVFLRLVLPFVKKKGPRLLREWILLIRGPRWWPAFLLTLTGWILEAAVIGAVLIVLAIPAGVGQTLFVHAWTIVGQTFHVTPGGIGTYETVMSGLLVQTAGIPLDLALQAAILSHAFKFLYSFATGGWALWRLGLSPTVLLRRIKETKGEGELDR